LAQDPEEAYLPLNAIRYDEVAGLIDQRQSSARQGVGR
jgi:hypothetical protein